MSRFLYTMKLWFNINRSPFLPTLKGYLDLTLGLEIERMPRARGTARRMFCSPYWRRCSRDRMAMSKPNSSAIATKAMPKTAGAWWLSPFSKWSAHIVNSACTCAQSPIYMNPTTASHVVFHVVKFSKVKVPNDRKVIRHTTLYLFQIRPGIVKS